MPRQHHRGALHIVLRHDDRATGRHDNWHRVYDPASGIYTTNDPIGLDGGLNRYTYVGGNPIGKIDLSDLLEEEPGLEGVYTKLYLLGALGDRGLVKACEDLRCKVKKMEANHIEEG